MTTMKKFLVILFIGFCDCVDEHALEGQKNFWIEDDYKVLGENNIIRPCPNYDLKCIRNYFVKNARCSPAYGRVPDPLILPQISLPLPVANMTYILTDVHINRLNGKVIEFYVNRMTDNVVLAVEFQDLKLYTSAGYIKYHRRGMEPIVTSDFATITYRSLVLTAVFPYINDLKLANAEITLFMEDPKPRYSIGPKASWSKDPVVLRSFAQLVSNPTTSIREIFVVQAPLFMNIFVQNRICDFGLKAINY